MGRRKHSKRNWKINESSHQILRNKNYTTYTVTVNAEDMGNDPCTINIYGDKTAVLYNAKLIAGAPDLLDIVEQYLDSMIGTNKEDSIAFMVAKQAYEAAAGLPYENIVIKKLIDNGGTQD